MMTCKPCKDLGGLNAGSCGCPCHMIFSSQVQYLLNENTNPITDIDFYKKVDL